MDRLLPDRRNRCLDPKRPSGSLSVRPQNLTPKGFQMAAPSIVTLLNALHQEGSLAEVDFLREGLAWFAQHLMELEVSQQIQAQPYERSSERTAQRNGYRTRELVVSAAEPWDTRVGTIDLAIPKLRTGSYFPSLLEPRRRAEHALLSVVQEAYLLGVSTRKVDNLVQSLGMKGISKSQVSQICSQLDAQGEAFRNRPLEGEYPYLWLDATFAHVRDDHKVTSQALVIAVAVNSKGIRE